MAKKEKKITMKEIDLGLDDVVKTLKSDMIKALDIKEASRNLEDTVRKLKDKEESLREVIVKLTTARDALSKELELQRKKEEELTSRVEDLKDDKAALESDKLTLTNEIKNLKKEKEQMQLSLEKTNDMLMELKTHISEFDEEIKR
jgi:chromosome segregation ATPase